MILANLNQDITLEKRRLATKVIRDLRGDSHNNDFFEPAILIKGFKADSRRFVMGANGAQLINFSTYYLKYDGISAGDKINGKIIKDFSRYTDINGIFIYTEVTFNGS